MEQVAKVQEEEAEQRMRALVSLHWLSTATEVEACKHCLTGGSFSTIFNSRLRSIR